MWEWIPNAGSKSREKRKPRALRLYCWIFSMPRRTLVTMVSLNVKQHYPICKNLRPDMIFGNKFDKTVICLAFIPNYISLFQQKHNTTQFEKRWHLKVLFVFVCLFVFFVVVCLCFLLLFVCVFCCCLFVFVFVCLFLYCCFFSHVLSKSSSFFPYILLQPRLDDAIKTWN